MTEQTYDLPLEWRLRKVGAKQYLVGSNRAIELIGSAPYFVEKLLDGLSHNQIVSDAAGDFGVDPGIIDRDLTSFLNYLRTTKIL